MPLYLWGGKADALIPMGWFAANYGSSRDLGSRNLGSRNLGSRNLGSRDLGSRNLGSRDQTGFPGNPKVENHRDVPMILDF